MCLWLVGCFGLGIVFGVVGFFLGTGYIRGLFILILVRDCNRGGRGDEIRDAVGDGGGMEI